MSKLSERDDGQARKPVSSVSRGGVFSLIIALIAGALLASSPDYTPAQVHFVQPGESLARIATGYQADISDVRRANPSLNGQRLGEGTLVLIPARFAFGQAEPQLARQESVRDYKVENGDNDWAISRRLGIKREELHKLNPGVDWSKLQIGQVLKVPGAAKPSAPQVSARTVRVVAQNVIVRSGPGQSHARVALVQRGASGPVLAQRDGWVQIRLSPTTQGWIRGDLVSSAEGQAPAPSAAPAPAPTPVPAPPVSTSSVDRVRIIKDGVNLRTGASSERDVVATLNEDEAGTVLDRLNGWIKVRTDSGKTGWVRGDMTVATAAGPSGAAAAPSPAPAAATPAPAPSSAASGRVKVIKTDVRVRSGASTQRDVVGKVTTGQVGVVRDKMNGWLKVDFSNGVKGWVRGDMVQGISSPQAAAQIKTSSAGVAVPAAIKSAEYVKAKGSSVRLRSGPSTQRSQVGSVNSGDFGKVLERSGDWVKADWHNKRAGWVRADFLTPLAAADAQKLMAERKAAPAPAPAAAMPTGTANSLLATARAQMGVRYRWAGTSRSGFDCSGFTTFVFAKHGVKLPRTSIAQSQFGQPVARGSIRAGDLVFFKTRGSRVSHVGIAISASQFIHASSGGGKVMVSSMTSGYYDRRYAGARRVLGVKAAQAASASAAVEARANPSPRPAPAPRTQAEPGAYMPLTPQMSVEPSVRPLPTPSEPTPTAPPAAPSKSTEEPLAPVNRVKTGNTTTSK